MTKFATLAAASALALIPLTGAHAEYEDPKSYGFNQFKSAPVPQKSKAVRTQRVVPTQAGTKSKRQNRADSRSFVFDGENISE